MANKQQNYSVEDQLELIKRGAADLVREDELAEKLGRANEIGKPLQVKLGVDPTAPDIHLGTAVVLRKLRQFQDLGHQAVLIIGDFTALVGDPSGQSKTRPQLTREQVEANAQTYFAQVRKILDMDSARIVRNSHWFSKFTFEDVIKLACKMTLARTIERDDFAKRFEARSPIGLHELLYPLMQGYDSVAVKAEVEVGGQDQTFNLLMAREIQRDFGYEPQVALTLPLLVGTDGVAKMSKSYGNYIGIDESPQEIFGKVMSIPDTLLAMYFELCTNVPGDKVSRLLAPDNNPRDAKLYLAREIVKTYYSASDADRAAQEFDRVFRDQELPSEIPEVHVPASELKDGKVWVTRLVVLCGFAGSNSEARRLIEQGAASIDGRKLTDPNADVVISPGAVLRVGRRRFARLLLEP